MVEGSPMELSQNIFIIAEVCIPLVDADDCLCCGIDRSSSYSRDLRDAVEAKSDGGVFE